MTTDSLPTDDDPRRLLSDVRTLAHRVRLDQRVTWVALLVLAVATFAAIPADYYGMVLRCGADGEHCQFWRRGVLLYWPPVLLLAYAAIAYCYVRVARSRGLGARVLPYAITGAALTILFTVTWILARVFLYDHPVTFPSWVLVLDRLIAPAGTIGIALLVLARLERNVALLVFTLGYLAVVLVPIDLGWGQNWGTRTTFLPGQIITGTVLLLGAIGFAVAGRRHR